MLIEWIRNLYQKREEKKLDAKLQQMNMERQQREEKVEAESQYLVKKAAADAWRFRLRLKQSEVLPVWYNQSEGLFPVKTSEADQRLFLMMGDAQQNKIFVPFLSAIGLSEGELMKSVKFFHVEYGRVDIKDEDGGSITRSCTRLLFPADDPVLTYREEVSAYPYITALYLQHEVFNGMAGRDDEWSQDEPSLSRYYTADFDDNPNHIISYQEHRAIDINTFRFITDNTSLPVYPDNTAQLRQALSALTSVLEHQRRDDLSIWQQRINTSVAMLDSGVDFPPIILLHNAGLFDIHSLKSKLLAGGAEENVAGKVCDDLTRELHRFAMFHQL